MTYETKDGKVNFQGVEMRLLANCSMEMNRAQ